MELTKSEAFNGTTVTYWNDQDRISIVYIAHIHRENERITSK
jgi:hypothetical protein